MSKPNFLNFQVDHMTLLVDPAMYNVSYAIFRIIFGVEPEGILYEKRKEWVKGQGEVSMTYAARIGESSGGSRKLHHAIVAVVQPSEPASQSSHVRTMLSDHRASAHWQHIALRTPNLLAFHQYASERGVNFITPVLKDADEDLIQVFSGEWYLPGSLPSGLFFEFVERNPTPALIKKLEERNRESWFRDKVFLGLYGEKEGEYQRGRVAPFIDADLFDEIRRYLESKKVWKISHSDLSAVEEMMISHAAAKSKTQPSRA
ncbi:MAG: hypothetical protein HY547_08050 [Elusimicrobia bacterium]|nr:hypothetical protein [Elusimicrobiota bacterium]